MNLKIFLTLTILQCVSSRQEFLGCYENLAGAQTVTLDDNSVVEHCVQYCYERYFRYAMIRNENICACGKFHGEKKDSNYCRIFCPQCDLKYDIADMYFTGLSVSGPPLNLKVTNITDTCLYISWNAPEFVNDVQYYKVKADVVKSYATSKLLSPEWEFPNNTFQNELNSLHPGTIYNITVAAVSSSGVGVPAFQTIETQIGVPSHMPPQPKVISRDATSMTVKLEPTENDNGPITSYYVAVINTDSLQTVEVENLKSVQEANDEGLSYYVTAEIQPDKIKDVFVIGDGKYYGDYYNAPLQPKANYDVIIGLFSKTNDVTHVLYGARNEKQKEILTENYGDEDGPPAVIVALSIAIGIVSCLIVAGLLVFFILRRHINNRFRQRLRDVQELTLQGPMVDVENNGFIPEEEIPYVNHYKNLKNQVWTIPQNILNMQSAVILGTGRFGTIYKGTIAKDNELINVCVYSIPDHKFHQEEKREMLKDLDLLIKTGKHRNVLEFIGTCENVDAVNVVLEHATLSLKEFLIGSRIPSFDRFTTMTEAQALEFGIDVAKGMAHLHEKKILHKKLCSRHVTVVNGNRAKISGYGLTEFYKDARTPNCTRWTAKEVFMNRKPHYKSDVWSFACLLWEVCTLGGTPYGDIPNSDIPLKVKRGLLLPQLVYIYDSLYQIFLNCWQLDLDERPYFTALVESLEDLKQQHSNNYLTFRLYQGFQFEQVHSELELETSIV